MIAILTGDIIGSRKMVATENWIQPLQKILYEYGTTPRHWEIQRGDNFQLEINDSQRALEIAFRIKLAVKKVKGMDARIAIGLGDKTFSSDTISSSNGSAFIRSYHVFDIMRKMKASMLIKSGNAQTDDNLNLLLGFALSHADEWSIATSELVDFALRNPQLTQTEIADHLKVRQASVSAGLKRAHYKLFKQLLDFYRLEIGKNILITGN